MGVVVVVGSLVTAGFSVDATVRIYQNRHPENRLRAGKSVVTFLAPALYAVGGVVLLFADPSGLVWLVRRPSASCTNVRLWLPCVTPVARPIRS